MTSYTVLFVLSTLVAVYNLFVTRVYTKSLADLLSNSSFPPLLDALKDNTHFNNSRKRARAEYNTYSTFWMPTAWAILSLVVVTWIMNYGTQSLSNDDVMWLAIALTPAIARHFTHPIRFDWMVVWSAGMESVMVILKMQAMQARIEQMEKEGAPEEELQMAKRALAEIQRLIGIPAEPEQSVETE